MRELYDEYGNPHLCVDEELRRRLTGRGTETPEQIEERINRVNRELGLKTRYNHVVVNDDLEVACNELSELIEGYAHKQ